MSIKSLQHIHLSLCCTINLCTISEESNSKKVHKMSIQSLRHIHLSLHRTINLCAISEVSTSKKLTKWSIINTNFLSQRLKFGVSVLHAYSDPFCIYMPSHIMCTYIFSLQYAVPALAALEVEVSTCNFLSHGHLDFFYV